MSLRGYWNVIVDRADTLWGNSWATRRPSPGTDEDGGNGDISTNFCALRAGVEQRSSAGCRLRDERMNKV